MYIAHFRKKDGIEQPLSLHLQEAAEISQENGLSLGIPTLCYLAGILHDSGKYTEKFQTYLLKAKAGEEVKRGSVDHSTYGGKLIRSQKAQTKYEMMAMEMIANAIFAHHRPGGLLDFISGEADATSPFTERYQKNDLPEYEQVKERFFQEVLSEVELQSLLVQAGQELEQLAKEHGRISRTDQFHLLKMIYSALLDGDRRNTQMFEENKIPQTMDQNNLFKTLSQRLEETFACFKVGKDTPINRLRQEMADACLAAGKRPTGIYSLSIPTGGGKTLSSMRFALNHALANGKKRIIYIIPYSSIIEQNAAVFRKELEDVDHELILEHHANLVRDSEEWSEENESQQALMQDNWDSPIIVTTMVRFLENVYGGSTRNPRRIHQLLDSVLIFDEIQSLPPKCLSMFNSLLNFLKEYGNTTTVLCTATQPTLAKRKLPLNLADNAEIVPDLESASQAFERVQVLDRRKKDGWTAEELSDFAQEILGEERNLLMILNTKKAVREVYQRLKDANQVVYHLSTAMTPAHRNIVLKEIREALDAKESLICVTTPLIEAGVDISFSCVVRSVSGLDSIAQAAGRCNRNGESSTPQPVYLVNPIKELENIDKMTEIKTKVAITNTLLNDRLFLKDDSSVLNLKLMARFFDGYYEQVEKTGESEYLFNGGSQRLFDLMQKNNNRKSFYRTSKNEEVPTFLVSSSATIAKHFKVIDQQGESVLVAYGDGEELVGDLLGSDPVTLDKKWYQKAQQNSLNLFRHEFDQLVRDGMIVLTDEEVYVLLKPAYDEEFGLNIQSDSLSSYGF